MLFSFAFALYFLALYVYGIKGLLEGRERPTDLVSSTFPKKLSQACNILIETTMLNACDE